MAWKRRPPEGNVRRASAIGNNTRGTITNKIGRIVQYESFAERSLLLRLEQDRTVRDYASQPETLTFKAPDGQWHHYTPDVMVWRTDESIEMHEVTLSSRQGRDSQQWRMQAAKRTCDERGWRYVVHTEQTLPQGAELANLLALIAYRPTGYAHAAVQQWLEQANLPQIVTFGQLAERIATNTTQAPLSMYPGLYHEIWHGRLQIDWQQLLFWDGNPVLSRRMTCVEKP